MLYWEALSGIQFSDFVCFTSRNRVYNKVIGITRHLENKTYAKIRRNQGTGTAEGRELVREENV